jgi:predicted DNA-binding protein (UPF0251 family)
MRAKVTIPRVCAHCGAPFLFRASPSAVASDRGKFCSPACGFAGRARSGPVPVPFEDQVAVTGPNDCWLWTGGLDPQGYGRIWTPGGNRRAHRVAWERANGPIPAGLFVCHDCDNPPCCNPAHLFLDTNAGNTADRHRKGRDATGDRNGSRTRPERLARGDLNPARLYPERMPRGEASGQAKLTAEMVRAIRAAGAAGERQRDIARRYGLAQSQVWRLIHRLSWKHLD